jgi:hypothetical protein
VRCPNNTDALSKVRECVYCQKSKDLLLTSITKGNIGDDVRDRILDYANALPINNIHKIAFVEFIVKYTDVDSLIHRLRLTENDCIKFNFEWKRYQNLCKIHASGKNIITISRTNVEIKSAELTQRITSAFIQLKNSLPAELLEYMAPCLDMAADKATERISTVIQNEIMAESLDMKSDEPLIMVEPGSNQDLNSFIYQVVREGIPKLTLATNIEQTPLIFTDERMRLTHDALVEEGANIEIANRKSNTVFYAINDLNSTVIKCGFHTGTREALYNRYRTSGDFELIYTHRSGHAREFETRFHSLMKRYNVSRSSFDRNTDNSEWYSCDKATLLRGIAVIEDRYRQQFANDMINRFYQKIETIQSSSI